MEELVWLFPVLFIFHDMEEIIGFGPFMKKNQAFINNKLPMFAKMYRCFSTEGMAAAVMEELVLCIAISICVLVECQLILGLSAMKLIVGSILGLIIIGLNLKFAHAIIRFVTKKIEGVEN